MEISVRRATMDDAAGMARALARAFQDDPLFNWIIPDEQKRQRALEPLFDLGLRKMILKRRHGYTTDDYAGAATWAPPDTWRISPLAILPLVPGTIRAVGLGPLRRYVGGFNSIEKLHPHEPHWYLEGLGTDPARQRQGVGAALMKPVLDQCDREGVPAYLETQKLENVAYYRHHGFEVRQEMDIPRDGPHMWLMWREPQPW